LRNLKKKKIRKENRNNKEKKKKGGKTHLGPNPTVRPKTPLHRQPTLRSFLFFFLCGGGVGFWAWPWDSAQAQEKSFLFFFYKFSAWFEIIKFKFSSLDFRFVSAKII